MPKRQEVNFPFTIVDVIDALGLPIRKVHHNELYIDCPECIPNPANGHNGTGRCQVLVNDGVYSCQRCGCFGGGLLDLYCYFRGCDRKTANREMRQFVNAPVYVQRKEQISKIVKAAEQVASEKLELAPRSEIDKTYRCFLSLCTLEDKHKKDLIRRGLSEQNILHYGFKSAPTSKLKHKIIVDALLKRGCTLSGVPGFFVNKFGEWDFNMFSVMDGYIVPMCNLQNQVLGLQVRLDKPTSNAKYMWFSSKGKNKGTARTSVPHITNTHKLSESVYMTEGGLKADVAHILSGRTFVALAGVTQYKILPHFFAQLRKNGVKRIIDSFDADCKYNPQVEKSRQRLKEYVLKSGLEYYRLEWDENYKGIDDYLFAHPKGKRKFIVYDK